MKKTLNIFFVLITFFSLGLLNARDYESSVLPSGVAQAMKKGSSSELAIFFNNSIELEILGKDAIYSKSQAEMIMKDFFTKNIPSNFIVKFEGGRDNSQYAVGSLITDKGNFRINFLIKNQLIHQLRIEKE